MSRKVILGHGAFTTKSEMILVPPNTTITFLSDAGSPLGLPFKSTLPDGEEPATPAEGINGAFDYEKVAGLLDQFVQAETPRYAGDVVVNMQLSKASAESVRVAKALADAGKWGGEILLSPPDKEWSLCVGTEKTCPTPMLYVAQSRHEKLAGMASDLVDKLKEWIDGGGLSPPPEGLADFAAPELTNDSAVFFRYVLNGVPARKWQHGCRGILGKTVGEGFDLIWLACSGFKADPVQLKDIGLRQGLPKEMTERTHGPGSDWQPSPQDISRFNDLSARKIGDVPNKGSIRIRAGGALVLVGNDHEGDAENYIRKQSDLSEGKMIVKKAGAFTGGSFEVENISTSKQQAVREALGTMSKNEVTFT